MPHFLEELCITRELLSKHYHPSMPFKVLNMIFNIYSLFTTQIDQLLVHQKVELAEGNIVMLYPLILLNILNVFKFKAYYLFISPVPMVTLLDHISFTQHPKGLNWKFPSHNVLPYFCLETSVILISTITFTVICNFKLFKHTGLP